MIIRQFEAQPLVRSFHAGKTKFAQVGDTTTTFIQMWSLDGSDQINQLVGRNVRITVEVVDEGTFEPTRYTASTVPPLSRLAEGPATNDRCEEDA